MKPYPYWWDTVPPRVPSSDPMPGRADVAVIGGGYTGLAAALHLARVGASVVVLERERTGWGASSRNGGQVLTGLKVDAATLVAREGEARARALYQVSRDAMTSIERLISDERIDCEFERAGHLQAAWKPSHFASFREEQSLLARVFDHRVELVPKERQRSELGTDAYHGLIVDEGSAALNPARYADGLAAAAKRARAAIVERAQVDHVRRDGEGWTVETPRGRLSARDVLVATDGYTGAATPSLQRRIVPVGSYIIATEPLSSQAASTILPKRRVVYDSKHFLYYFRLTGDRRMLFGGRAEFSRPTEASMRRAAEVLRRGLVRVFPELAAVGVEYAWSGTVGFTRDQMPRAGRLDGLWYAGGYCGHGIAMATYLGALVARRIAGEPIDNPLFDDRWPAIPLYSGTPWFLPLVGAYYRVLDWVG